MEFIRENNRIIYVVEGKTLAYVTFPKLNDNTVIGGHQRYDVLMDMYMDNEIDKELSLLKLGDIGWVFTNDQLNVKDENFEKALNL